MARTKTTATHRTGPCFVLALTFWALVNFKLIPESKAWAPCSGFRFTRKPPPLLLTTSSRLSMTKEIYGVKGSGWASPTWNWGYAQGTGHDCAAICRRKYSTSQEREALVHRLCVSGSLGKNEEEVNTEELKLILGLAFQRGRWDGSDGGRGGYGQVLTLLANADRYEKDNDKESHRLLLQDMADRYPLLLVWANLDPELCSRLQDSMQECLELCDSNPTAGLRRCGGQVLQTMGFIQRGL